LASFCSETFINSTYSISDRNQTPSEQDSIAQTEIVYLTAESENSLTQLDPGALYVIGGLVDHNRLKSHVHNTVTQCYSNRIKTARLPIQECLINEDGRRTVITVNQVYQILNQYWQIKQNRLKAGLLCDLINDQKLSTSLFNKQYDDNYSMWADILMSVLPARSGWKPRHLTQGQSQTQYHSKIPFPYKTLNSLNNG